MSYQFKILFIFMTMIAEGFMFAFSMAIEQNEKKPFLDMYVFFHGAMLIIIEVLFIGYLIFSLFPIG